MSRTGALRLIFSELGLLLWLVGTAEIVRRSFRCPIAWRLAMVEFGLFFVGALLIGLMTYWAERRIKRRIWTSTTMVLAVFVTWPLRVVFLPSGTDFGTDVVFQLGMYLIVTTPIGWAIALEHKPKARGETDAK